MDTDLFQILALILLLGLLLTLFGVLQSLGAIRKTLEQRGPGEAAAAPVAQATAAPARAADEEPETWARPTEADASTAGTTGDSGWGGASRTGWPAPQEASPAPVVEDEPAAAATPSTGAGARVLYGDSGLTTATPSEAALRPAETVESATDTTAAASAGAAGSEVAGTMDTGIGGTTGVGAATTDTTAGTAGAGAVTETGRSTADDPQEQPFERDGRWWFRRGDELLVYEEQSGQWVPADEPSSAGSVAASAQPDAANTGAETTGASAEGQVTTQQEAAAGSFWKCPSCGAVNGSTATSCRMCFTARP